MIGLFGHGIRILAAMGVVWIGGIVFYTAYQRGDPILAVFGTFFVICGYLLWRL
ncbi:MAG: hypothetical protein ACYDAK_12960 [Candidatus Limnocylindrales bacterium]